MSDNNIIEIVNNDIIIEVEENSVELLNDGVVVLNYEYMINKPKINSVELTGNMTPENLNLPSVSSVGLKEDKSNKVTSISSSSTNTQYPSAKCVFDKINSKANTSANNFTAAGKTLISGYSMPSSNYTNLTLGESGNEYTAPANGWFTIAKIAGQTTHTYLDLINKSTRIGHRAQTYGSSSTGLSNYLPVLKDDVILVNYNATGDTTRFRFIYAQGEV